MSIRLLLECGGCDATATSEPWYRKFRSFAGRDYGFGSYYLPDPTTVCPDGWVLWDLINATYCPACWAAICVDSPPPEGLLIGTVVEVQP